MRVPWGRPMGASSLAYSRAPDPSWEEGEGSQDWSQVSPASLLWSPSATVDLLEMDCSWTGNPRSQHEESPFSPRHPSPFFLHSKKKEVFPWSEENCWAILRKQLWGIFQRKLKENPGSRQGKTPTEWWCHLGACGLLGANVGADFSQGHRRKRAQNSHWAIFQLPGLFWTLLSYYVWFHLDTFVFPSGTDPWGSYTQKQHTAPQESKGRHCSGQYNKIMKTGPQWSQTTT